MNYFQNEKFFLNLKNLREKIENWSKENLCILIDFDRTITRGLLTSWSCLDKYLEIISPGFTAEHQMLCAHYRSIELDLGLSEQKRINSIKEWSETSLKLFVKYKLEEKILEYAQETGFGLQLRKGAKEFFGICRQNNIPVTILSGGIGNVIERFLKYHDCLENVNIIANFIYFKDGIAIGTEEEIIHSSNKNMFYLPDENLQRRNTILIGDSVDDVRMLPPTERLKALKIGFIEYKIQKNLQQYIESYDVVCLKECSFTGINALIKNLKEE